MVGKPDSLGFTRKPPPSTFNYVRDTARNEFNSPMTVPVAVAIAANVGST